MPQDQRSLSTDFGPSVLETVRLQPATTWPEHRRPNSTSPRALTMVLKVCLASSRLWLPNSPWAMISSRNQGATQTVHEARITNPNPGFVFRPSLQGNWHFVAILPAQSVYHIHYRLHFDRRSIQKVWFIFPTL